MTSSESKRSQPLSIRLSMRSVWIAGGCVGRIRGANRGLFAGCRVTGSGLQAGPFLDYLETKYSATYGLA
jgi:hypothetical protein